MVGFDSTNIRFLSKNLTWPPDLHLTINWPTYPRVIFEGSELVIKSPNTKYNLSGDFDLESQEAGHVVCVDNVVDFTSAFLFSVETQHTIGWEFPRIP